MENHSDISKNFIPYNLALELKELGFEEECLAVYCGESNIRFRILEKNIFINDKSSWVTAPTFSQAFDWLLDKYKYWQFTFPNIHSKDWNYHIQYYDVNHCWGESFIKGGFKNKEQARLECIKKLIEIAKEKNVK